MASEFNLELDDSLNDVIDEAPGSNEGEEIAGKGVSFMTEEGPSNLVETLLSHGYGDTRKTLDSLKDREDFLVSVKEIITENDMDLDSVKIENIDSLDGEYYDPKSIL